MRTLNFSCCSEGWLRCFWRFWIVFMSEIASKDCPMKHDGHIYCPKMETPKRERVNCLTRFISSCCFSKKWVASYIKLVFWGFGQFSRSMLLYPLCWVIGNISVAEDLSLLDCEASSANRKRWESWCFWLWLCRPNGHFLQYLEGGYLKRGDAGVHGNQCQPLTVNVHQHLDSITWIQKHQQIL